MKKIEILALLLIVLWIFTLGANRVTIAMGQHLTSQEFTALALTHKGMALCRSILTLAIQIGIGIWLFIQARRDKATSWVWMLFGFVFGISAAILYFLMQLLQETRLNRASEKSG